MYIKLAQLSAEEHFKMQFAPHMPVDELLYNYTWTYKHIIKLLQLLKKVKS